MLTRLPKGVVLDIEEEGGWSYSPETATVTFQAEGESECQATMLGIKENRRRERQRIILGRAQKTLKRHHAGLRVAESPCEIIRCLEEIKHTHASPFSLTGIGVYARCVYYLRRFDALKRR